jgi:hypothetical protein
MAVFRLMVALSQHQALVGLEHGRTIPLADIGYIVERRGNFVTTANQ